MSDKIVIACPFCVLCSQNIEVRNIIINLTNPAKTKIMSMAEAVKHKHVSQEAWDAVCNLVMFSMKLLPKDGNVVARDDECCTFIIERLSSRVFGISFIANKTTHSHH
jgi:hypothetical protein